MSIFRVDLLHSLNVIDFKIIFVSAFEKNTIQAFRLSCIQYLLKPVNPEDLKAAVRQAEEADQVELALQLRALNANSNSQEAKL